MWNRNSHTYTRRDSATTYKPNCSVSDDNCTVMLHIHLINHGLQCWPSSLCLESHVLGVFKHLIKFQLSALHWCVSPINIWPSVFLLARENTYPEEGPVIFLWNLNGEFFANSYRNNKKVIILPSQETMC